MNYWELRREVAKLVPRMTRLAPLSDRVGMVKEKGRKANYHQFNLTTNKWVKNERLLNTEEINSFAEISIRAAACPMPLNLDVWDGLKCGFGCKYCYADSFRASLYTAFFDNSKSVGMRHCNPTYYKQELDKLLPYRGDTPTGNDVRRAISKGIPIRLGIRFEDFLPVEAEQGVSLELLKYLQTAHYPVMINTKSDLVGHEDYVRVLADNPGGAAVHITLISSDNYFLKRIETGAPSYEKRLWAMRELSEAGVRVVARIEPYMVFLNDKKDEVERYIQDVYTTGVRHITFDTYSYSANNPGIRRNFELETFDFLRMFTLTTDSQPIGSILLGEFMRLFRQKGFSCSTFDLGNVPDNDHNVCCEVDDAFNGTVGWNDGSSVSAIRFIQRAAPEAVGWNDFEEWIDKRGGFLSDNLRTGVQELWNLDGNASFHVAWGKGIIPAGQDDYGMRWRYNARDDFRQGILKGVM